MRVLRFLFKLQQRGVSRSYLATAYESRCRKNLGGVHNSRKASVEDVSRIAASTGDAWSRGNRPRGAGAVPCTRLCSTRFSGSRLAWSSLRSKPADTRPAGQLRLLNGEGALMATAETRSLLLNINGRTNREENEALALKTLRSNFYNIYDICALR